MALSPDKQEAVKIRNTEGNQSTTKHDLNSVLV
jgi:hypothetical protein